ncbi:bifunctional riboflavin kinase/FAD synthetase [Paenibacillus antarcticus]|uniref:Riboflavin biosynthesis protein n=1 Tax=Paenibacillus antarcticus TaxID=253703 RepID=A0A168KX13_9BACL|nr:bifunctional riboflavin kinase/FAD synthetase [Paenibacillus antarcticus]OAB42569.1 hypothetical protein PBAT_19935 [Paenibacillus antarcticus]
MEYIEITSKPPEDSTPIVLVIGKFDGVHRGHSQLLHTASEFQDGMLTVMSFSEHPSWIVKKDPAYDKSLTPVHHKMELLQNDGVKRFYNIHFTKDYAQITAKEFVLDHLSRLNIKHIVVGEGFHLGKARESDTLDLIRLCKQIGIPVTVIPLLKEVGEKIDSTAIRSLIKNGEVVAAQGLLGRPYTVRGNVIHGEALGRTLGFPTINLGGEVAQYVLPKPGVYLGIAEIVNGDHGQERRNALISAGYRPTVEGETYLIEAYLLDYSGDLYEKKVSLSFVSFLREEIKFSDLDELVEQMKLDERDAFVFFENV